MKIKDSIINGTYPTKEDVRRRKRRTGSSAPWTTRAEFECYEGAWRLGRFETDPDVVEWLTEYAANNDGRAWLREQIRADSSERRIVIYAVIGG